MVLGDNMVYLFYGLEQFLIDNEIKKIIEKNKIDEFNISKYDLENDSLDNILEDIETPSLFGDKKIVIVNNSYIFTPTTKKTNNITNLDKLEEYLNNINDLNILIFTVNEEKLDERKKIVKKIKEQGKVLEFNKNTNINNLVSNMFDDYKINANDITFLINRVGNDLSILKQEIEKLKIYKLEDKIITKEDILNLTNKTINLDIFNFINNIISKNKNEAIEIYYELLKQNEEPIKIIVMLANQFRLMYQCKELALKGYSEKDIASTLSIHPYRAKMCLQNGRKYSSDLLLSYLKQLSDLDLQIKHGFIDKNIGLELFILGL